MCDVGVLGGEGSRLFVTIYSRAFSHHSEIFTNRWQAGAAASLTAPHLILLTSCLYTPSQVSKNLSASEVGALAELTGLGPGKCEFRPQCLSEVFSSLLGT